MDGSNHENSAERPAKVRRIRLACLRCQTRKIKCDGLIPKCSACHKADAECIDGRTTVQEGAISRSEATALHGQIRRLEQALQSTRPGVNIEELVNGNTDTNLITPTRIARTNHSASLEPQLVPPSNEVESGRQNGSVIPQTTTTPYMQNSTEVAHEIGLIPLSAGVNKYVGPSSGFSFAKLLFARADQAGASPESSYGHSNRISQESPSTINSRSKFVIRPAAIPDGVEHALQLSRIYFEHVHVCYPFLHEPSHNRLIEAVYHNGPEASRLAQFQVTMVLAISATILSKRLRIPFTGEGLCATAMEHVTKIDLQNSVEGVQCLLLIAMFTLHSPYLGISPWYLSYQCLAAVLDLGLQRDVPAGATVSHFDREMRTRVFWVIYTLDRTLATTLGRPIGLRDEGCDLRLPTVAEDTDLDLSMSRGAAPTRVSTMPGSISCSIFLFKLALLNSEIKYILHSVTRNLPKWTYPQIPDIQVWQADFWSRLQGLYGETPSFGPDNKHLTTICHIRYHEIVMLLFRPTPRIRTPTKDSLQHCHQSAQATIEAWKELYETDRMSYSWITIHSVCLSAITLLYCIWTVPEIASSTKIDVLTSIMRDASNLLTAAGEHWTEARRSRNSMDDLTAATVRWLLDAQTSRRTQEPPRLLRSTQVPSVPATADTNFQAEAGTAQHPNNQTFGFDSAFDFPGIDTYIDLEDLAVFVGAPDPFATNFSDTVDGMFSAYQPFFDF